MEIKLPAQSELISICTSIEINWLCYREARSNLPASIKCTHFTGP